MNRIQKGDEVVIVAGKDKGKRGSVQGIVTKKDQVIKCVVDGVNLIKKHVKPNPQLGEQGGIVEKVAPIAISNVMHFDATSGKPSKVGFKTLEDGRKVRFYKKSGEVIDS